MRTLTHLLLTSLIRAAPSHGMTVALNAHAGLGQEQDHGRSLTVDPAAPHVQVQANR